MSIQQFINIFGVLTIRYFVVAGIAFLVCYIWLKKWLSSAKIQSREAGKKDFLREISYSMLTTVVFTIIACAVFFTPLRSITQVYTKLSDYPMWWLYTSVVLSLVAHDTYFYWMHRALHHPKLFKYAHVLHHRSTNPSPWTSYSFSFLEAWAEGLILLIIVVIMPMHPIAISLFVVIGFIINVYGHLGYEIAPKWLRHTFLFQITNTSVHHNLHHSKFTGNYGLYFRFWDRLMGTENPDYVKEYDRVQQNRLSNKGSEINPNLHGNLDGERGIVEAL